MYVLRGSFNYNNAVSFEAKMLGRKKKFIRNRLIHLLKKINKKSFSQVLGFYSLLSFFLFFQKNIKPDE
jgi:hypothetical protein